MNLLEWIYLTVMIVLAVMFLGDAINSATAAVRELIQVMRRDKP